MRPLFSPSFFLLRAPSFCPSVSPFSPGFLLFPSPLSSPQFPRFTLQFILSPFSIFSPYSTLTPPLPLRFAPPAYIYPSRPHPLLGIPPPPSPHPNSPPWGMKEQRGGGARGTGTVSAVPRGEESKGSKQRRGRPKLWRGEGHPDSPAAPPPLPRSHRAINQGQGCLANGGVTRKSACQAQPMRGGVKSSPVSAWPMRSPGLTINLPVRDSERERACERASAARAGDRGGGAGRAGRGDGERARREREELRRKKAITEVPETKTAYRRDGQMQRDKEKPREIASGSQRLEIRLAPGTDRDKETKRDRH